MKQEILKVLEAALEEVKPMLDKEVVFSPALRLTGSSGCLDSMALVSFIAAAEELLAAQLGREIKLVTDRAFSRGSSPFYSISTLAAFIEEIA